MNDDELRNAYQARKSPAPGSPPPSAEELARLVSGIGPEKERLELLDRALAHPESAREFELLRSIAAAEQAEAAPRVHRWRVPMAWAATVTLAASATLLVLSRRESDQLRAPAAAGAPAPISPGERAVQAVGSIRFVWHRVRNAGGYRLELLTEAGVLVTTKQSPDTTTAIEVPDADDYRWLIVALLPDGEEVISRPRRLTITP